MASRKKRGNKPASARDARGGAGSQRRGNEKPSVLGNDPFTRSAAPRTGTSGPPPPPLPGATKGRPATPELQAPTMAVKGPSKPLHQPEPHAGSPGIGVDPRPWAGAPSAQELDGPVAHSGTPTAVPLELGTPHAGSPSVVSETGATEPVPHPDAPSAEVLPAVESEPSSPMGALRGLARALRSAVGLSSSQTLVDSWGKDRTLTQSLRPLAELLYDKYWRVKTLGIENVPAGPCILVANHAGALPLDGPVLHLALRRERPELVESRWLLEDQVFYAPFVGVLSNRLGAVRATPENAHRLLDEGRPVIVFPEGFHGVSKPFSERYQLKRFGRGGYLKIALRAQVPIIPVAIVGGEESMPLLSKLPGKLLGLEYLPLTLPPLPAKWQLQFGAPLSLEGAPSDPEADLSWIEGKNLEVRDRIESMLKDLLASRASVF